MLSRCLPFLLLAVSALAEPQPQTYTLPPEKLAKAIEYARARNRLHFAATAYGFAVLAGVVGLKIAPRLRSRVEKWTRRRAFQAFLFTPPLLLAVDAAMLPAAVYGHHLSLKFDQSIQGWESWFWDWTKAELLTFLISAIAVWLLYGVIRRSPRRWWFYGWLASVPLTILLVFAAPVLIDPLFDRFEPLSARRPDLVAAIEKVAARGGLSIPPSRMFEMRASEKWKALNAYVTGVGASKRVVVWDTTMRRMTTGQTLFVFGHEMGHYVLGHVWLGIGAACAALLIGLYLGYRFLRLAVARWGGRWDIRGVEDWASLPVLMLALAVLSFAAEPLENSFSRRLEHEADIYGLEVIHGIVPDSARVAARSFQILGEVSLSDPHPGPFVEFWLYDHPPVSERVRFASEYDPWGKGEEPKYVR
ncbi:MAG: M48 family metallopeptidase [Acidobacteriia bacterium]|nr:M48 family metallopeptidase [Terriglobia bacterium]